MLTKAETKDKGSARQLCLPESLALKSSFTLLLLSPVEQPASFFFFFFYSVFPDSFLSLFEKQNGADSTLRYFLIFEYLSLHLSCSPSSVYVQIHSQPLSSCLTFPPHLSFLFLPPHFFFFWIICCRCHKSSLCLFVARNRHADRQRGRQKDKQAHEEWKTILYEDTEKQTEVRGLRGPDWDGSEQKSIRDTLFLECNPSGLLLA